MALDAQLLESAENEGKPGYRVYGWDGPWVSLGMWQDPERDLLDPSLVPWVMRPTGGGAVLHGHDVTVALAAPLELILERRRRRPNAQSRLEEGFVPQSRSVRAMYRWLTAPILEALRECGLPAVLAENRDGSRPPSGSDRSHSSNTTHTSHRLEETGSFKGAPDCFGRVSPNDIVHAGLGMKVCGCALRVTRRASLLQASIPTGTPLIDPRRVFERASQLDHLPWNPESFMYEFSRILSRVFEFDP